MAYQEVVKTLTDEASLFRNMAANERAGHVTDEPARAAAETEADEEPAAEEPVVAAVEKIEAEGAAAAAAAAVEKTASAAAAAEAVEPVEAERAAEAAAATVVRTEQRVHEDEAATRLHSIQRARKQSANVAEQLPGEKSAGGGDGGGGGGGEGGGGGGGGAGGGGGGEDGEREGGEEHRAARRMQSLERGRQARRDATVRAEQRVHEDEAATRLQSIQRGRVARKQSDSSALPTRSAKPRNRLSIARRSYENDRSALLESPKGVKPADDDGDSFAEPVAKVSVDLESLTQQQRFDELNRKYHAEREERLRLLAQVQEMARVQGELLERNVLHEMQTDPKETPITSGAEAAQAEAATHIQAVYRGRATRCDATLPKRKRKKARSHGTLGPPSAQPQPPPSGTNRPGRSRAGRVLLPTPANTRVRVQASHKSDGVVGTRRAAALSAISAAAAANAIIDIGGSTVEAAKAAAAAAKRAGARQSEVDQIAALAAGSAAIANGAEPADAGAVAANMAAELGCGIRLLAAVAGAVAGKAMVINGAAPAAAGEAAAAAAVAAGGSSVDAAVAAGSAASSVVQQRGGTAAEAATAAAAAAVEAGGVETGGNVAVGKEAARSLDRFDQLRRQLRQLECQLDRAVSNADTAEQRRLTAIHMQLGHRIQACWRRRLPVAHVAPQMSAAIFAAVLLFSPIAVAAPPTRCRPIRRAGYTARPRSAANSREARPELVSRARAGSGRPSSAAGRQDAVLSARACGARPASAPAARRRQADSTAAAAFGSGSRKQRMNEPAYLSADDSRRPVPWARPPTVANAAPTPTASRMQPKPPSAAFASDSGKTSSSAYGVANRNSASTRRIVVTSRGPPKKMVPTQPTIPKKPRLPQQSHSARFGPPPSVAPPIGVGVLAREQKAWLLSEVWGRG